MVCVCVCVCVCVFVCDISAHISMFVNVCLCAGGWENGEQWSLCFIRILADNLIPAQSILANTQVHWTLNLHTERQLFTQQHHYNIICNDSGMSGDKR